MTLYGAGFRNERVTLDMCGPIKFTRVPYTYLLVICDVFTKYVMAVPLRSSDAVTIAQAFLDRWCNVFGFPYHLHTDQGSNLTGELWKDLCCHLRIERTRTTAYRPQANGQNERTNRTIVQLLRTTQEHHEDWYRRISHVCFAYNSSAHVVTGFTPHYLMFGSEPFSDFDVRMPDDPTLLPLPVQEHAQVIVQHINDAHVAARKHFKEAAETRKRYYDREVDKDGHNRRRRTYTPGELVLLKVSDHHLHLGKMNDRYDGPYYVITVFDTGVMRVKEAQRPDRPPKMVHHDRVRRFIQEEPKETPRWVHDAIVAFNRRAAATTQTEEDIALSVNDVATPSTSVSCVCCKQGRVDKFSIVRTFDYERRCHLCHDSLAEFVPLDMDAMDDVTDHDLYHC